MGNLESTWTPAPEDTDATIAEAQAAAIQDTNTKLQSYSTTEQMNTAIENAVDGLEIGGRNLLLNSAILPLAGSSNWRTGTWRLAGTSGMSRSIVIIADPPNNVAVTKAFQCVGSQSWVDGSDIGIDSFPKTNGEFYCLSCWARVVGGGIGFVGFSIYNAEYISG